MSLPHIPLCSVFVHKFCVYLVAAHSADTLRQSDPPTWPDAHFDDICTREDELLHHLPRYHVARLKSRQHQP